MGPTTSLPTTTLESCLVYQLSAISIMPFLQQGLDQTSGRSRTPGAPHGATVALPNSSGPHLVAVHSGSFSRMLASSPRWDPCNSSRRFHFVRIVQRDLSGLFFLASEPDRCWPKK